MMNKIITTLFLSFSFSFSIATISPALHNPTPDNQTNPSVAQAQSGEIYHSPQGKKSAGLETKLSDKISLSGLIELEAGYSRIYFTDATFIESSDTVLATAQVAMSAELNDKLTTSIILLFEEDATDPIAVDEGLINYKEGLLSASFGKQTLPFGVFHSHFISDPWLLAIGETKESALVLNVEQGIFNISLFASNGNVKQVGIDNVVQDFGGCIHIVPIDGIEIGGSVLSDLADSDAELVGTISSSNKQVPGWSAYVLLSYKNIAFSIETLAAANAFAAADLDANANGTGDTPLAWNTELAYVFYNNIELALRVEGTQQILNAPQLQAGIVGSWGIMENTSLALEYLAATFDSEFGTPAATQHLFTTQVAVEF